MGNRQTTTTRKLIIIGILFLALIIPTAMIQFLIHERSNHRNEAIADVNSKWGTEQTISGPILMIPYIERQPGDAQGIIETKRRYILPEELNLSGNLTATYKKRGIYDVVLYGSTLSISGNFAHISTTLKDIDSKAIDWKNATLLLGISDLTGIQSAVSLTLNGKTKSFEPGVQNGSIISSGFHATLSEISDTMTFSINVELNGSESLLIAPLGKTTSVSLKSDWKTPSFIGNALPRSHTKTPEGFEANWKTLYLNRDYPQSWSSDSSPAISRNIQKSLFGVNLYIEGEVYKQVTRVSKYSVLFILLTFLSFFCVEILNRRFVHPFQYLLIGFAVSMFYILLLAFSEHIGFDNAYLIATLTTTGLISAYSIPILKHPKLTKLLATVLLTAYTYLYITLQLEDFALLFGSLGLLAALGVTMYMTRNIDWDSIDEGNTINQTD